MTTGEPARAPTSGDAEAAKPARILVVDDEPEMLALLCAVLRGGHRGAHVEAAASPTEALQADDQQPVDLLVTDYMMPTMNGLELAKRFRDRRPDLPIILLTAYSDAKLQNQAFLARVNVFLNKPVDPRELLREVQRALIAA